MCVNCVQPPFSLFLVTPDLKAFNSVHNVRPYITKKHRSLSFPFLTSSARSCLLLSALAFHLAFHPSSHPYWDVLDHCRPDQLQLAIRSRSFAKSALASHLPKATRCVACIATNSCLSLGIPVSHSGLTGPDHITCCEGSSQIRDLTH